MVNLTPYQRDVVPFVVESMGQLNGKEFSICVIVGASQSVMSLTLPKDRDCICQIIKAHCNNNHVKRLEELRNFDLLFDEDYCNGV